MTGDEWTTSPLGSPEFRRGGVARGWLLSGSVWRTARGALGSEKDAETARIAVRAAVDAEDLRGAL